MRHLFVSFKTAVTAEISLTKMKMDEYIAKAAITAMGLALDTEPAMSFKFPFPEAVHVAAKTIAHEPHAIFAHNVAFHRACWQKMGWPEPAQWCCTLAALKTVEPTQKKFSMAALCERHGLPPRIDAQEHTLNGTCPPILLESAERDANLVRALAEITLQYPRTAFA